MIEMLLTVHLLTSPIENEMTSFRAVKSKPGKSVVTTLLTLFTEVSFQFQHKHIYLPDGLQRL